MPLYHLDHLDRNAYLDSIAKIADPKTVRFATMSMEWWDRHFSWKAQGCMALTNESGDHLCYIFYSIDRYHEYMTIHNIFTPLDERRKGYAYELLSTVFDLAHAAHVRRFRLVSISRSLDFYLSLGFVYWGLNSVGDYYCDLPMPTKGLGGLADMVEKADMAFLVGRKLDAICAKVNGNELKLTVEKSRIFETDKRKMKAFYMFDELQKYKTA